MFQKYGDDMDDLPEDLAGGMALLPELLLESRSHSTSKSYFQGFKKWKQWANSNGLGSSRHFACQSSPCSHIFGFDNTDSYFSKSSDTSVL